MTKNKNQETETGKVWFIDDKGMLRLHWDPNLGAINDEQNYFVSTRTILKTVDADLADYILNMEDGTKIMIQLNKTHEEVVKIKKTLPDYLDKYPAYVAASLVRCENDAENDQTRVFEIKV